MFRKALVYIIPLVVLCCIYAGSGQAGKVQPENVPLRSEDREMVKAINTFTFDLFKEIVANEGFENVFISPFSVSYALGMTYNGARGTTAEAMADVLKYGGLDNQMVNETYRNLRERLLQLDPKVIIEIANSIWYRQGFAVDQMFLDINNEYFDSRVAGLNFNDPGAADIINKWVSEATHGKIKGMISPPIDPLMMMYLVNAIYFKGTWDSEFKESRTRPEPFYPADGPQINCDMMHQTSDYSFFIHPDYTVIDMPYGNGSFSMAAFLPAEGMGVNELIVKLDEDSWSKLGTMMSRDEVKLYLPKFKLEYKLKMNEVLQALGMEIAFIPRKADFSGISAVGDTLYISEVLHKTFVQVDEKGTEAAAATSVGVMALSAMPMEPIVIRFDRPFVYVIYDKTSGTILFIGKIEEPKWEEG
jgi:serine protease inhibitor